MNAAISMHATMMHLAIRLPDWNSLDSVRRAHNRLEGSALVFFALLVVFDVLAHLSAKDKSRETLFEKIGLCCFAIAVLAEIVAYPYGQRNDTLSAQVIGSLDAKSREAFTNASSALTKSGAAETKADEAETKSGEAQSEAEAADARAKFVARKAAELDDRLSIATQKLDNVEGKRAELEKSLRNLAACTAPRVIPVWSIGSPKDASGVRVWSTFNGPLLPFKGWKVLIEYVPNDAETLRAAFNLARAFGDAGWDAPPPQPSSEKLSDGVEVQGFELSLDELSHGEPDVWSETRARDAAAVAVNFLHSYNWEATLGWQNQEDVNRHIIPRQGIRVLIGLYPPVWFVAPPAMKDWAAFNARFQKDRDEAEQAAEQARRESNAKLYAKINPEWAERMKAEEAQLEQERKAALQPYTSPCQPLESVAPY